MALRAARGDPGAQSDLEIRLTPIIRARVRARMIRHGKTQVGTWDECDIAQEVWMTLMKEEGQQLVAYDPSRGSLEGYVSMISERILGNLWQKVQALKRSADREPSTENIATVPSDGPTPAELAEARDSARALLTYLRRELPPKGQAVLAYLYEDELGVDEVAKIMGVKRQVVYNWNHKIRSMAARFLDAQ
ncbi:MAG: sigma-70 family RNA polymerase sigma factor [Myxococcota bacterium]